MLVKSEKSEELFIRQKYILNLWKKEVLPPLSTVMVEIAVEVHNKNRAKRASERKVLVIKLQIIMLYKNSRRHISAFNYDADFLCVLFIGVDENYARQKPYGEKKNIYSPHVSLFFLFTSLFMSRVQAN